MTKNCAKCGGSLRADGGCGQCEQAAGRRNQRRILGLAWMPFADAARLLGVERHTLSDHLRQYLTHKSASLKAHGARNVGYVYRRADVFAARTIRDALGCSARRACETLSAIRTLRGKGLLDDLEKQLTLTFEETHGHSQTDADIFDDAGKR